MATAPTAQRGNAKRRVAAVAAVPNSELGTAKKRQMPHMLCCVCGVSMETNPSSMCINCLRANVDITAGLPTQLILHQCRNCARYLGHSTSSAAWVECDHESQDMMAICLRKVTGLRKKVRLIDAKFQWTEPHSKRVVILLTVQKEVFDMVLRQTFKVTYVVQNQQCDRCVKEAAVMQWAAIVQVRQKVLHKRTIFFMEQKILKHDMHAKCAGIKPVPGAGLDFYFADRSHARAFIAFLDKIVPISLNTARQLSTHDDKSNVYTFKYNFMVDIAPVSVDDLVVLPTATAQRLSNICPLALCYKLSNVLHFIDPVTLATAELQTKLYWAEPFRALCSKNRLVPFVVLDVQPLRTEAALDAMRSCRGKFKLVEATVARPRDVGDAERSYTVVSHLGNLLQAGDM
jgi:nonsense-mediated mRNA decay protein 3